MNVCSPVGVQLQVFPSAVPSSEKLEGRVDKVSQGIFQEIKDAGNRAWRVMSAVGEGVSGLVFYVLTWIYPSIGDKVHNVYLRIQLIWKSGTLEELRNEIKTLNAKVVIQGQQIANLEIENGELQKTSIVLKEENKKLKERAKLVGQEKETIRVRETAVVEIRDLAEEENEALLQEIEALSQKISDLQTNDQQKGEDNLTPISERKVGFLDEETKNFLLAQLVGSQQMFAEAERSLPASPAKIALQRGLRIIEEVERADVEGYQGVLV